MTPDEGIGAWKGASSSRHQSATPAEAHSFPPLGAKGPSKAQIRARSRYTQPVHFEPYPPRLDQLTRQELSRLESDFELSSVGDDWEMREDDLVQPGYVQRSGMSSVTVYDASGQCLSRGPDIYRRGNPNKSRRETEKAKERVIPNVRMDDKDQSDQRKTAFAKEAILPLPFTDQRLDTLLTECQRLQRVQAIEERSSVDKSPREDPFKPLKDNIINAFSSLDGFLAAFGNESIGADSEREKK
ncbi:hypothetical protein CBS101457_001531 [Exobasidium rhododendri]|nr:hypothetical protein CBS101457_001531 [Exobasidium rhododendri]